jgi:hypothetical protein
LRNFEHVENDFGTAMARKWDIGSAADQLWKWFKPSLYVLKSVLSDASQ